ncbi:MAG: LysM peptidoglycan-binding domain-containing protein [Alphaproteobacteria bacterium]|nr:LysM peptidoglycan-binding domain-containing protein [Alphaproteobacteria bacterium]
MGADYIVKKGDYLTKIAHDHGFDDWRTIYNSPENAAFRARRPNPNLIYPGDRIVIPKVVTGVTAAGATLIPPTGNANIIHFVTPKGSGDVTLTATIAPDTARMRSKITWDGATAVPGNPLSATVSKAGFGKTVVTIKLAGLVQQELRVWVIWATITVTDVPIAYADLPNVVAGKPGGDLEGGFNFFHTIQPPSVITDADRPDLTGANVNAPPGGNHPIFGAPLANGANRKWDSSRQMKLKILNPVPIPNADFEQPVYVSVPSFPANDVEGNDDRSVGDENNNPYTNGGKLNGFDSPSTGIAHSAGANGNTVEFRLHFREFARVELAGTWHRISDFFPWRIHLVFKRAGGKWVDGGTNKATDNAGF